MVSDIPCLGTTVAIPAAISDAATHPTASARQLLTSGALACSVLSPAYQPPTISAITSGVSAHSLPTSTAQRAIGRDHRYVLVRSSISSPIDALMNIAGTIASSRVDTLNRSRAESDMWRVRTMLAYATGSAANSTAIHSALPRPSRLSVTPARVHIVDSVPGTPPASSRVIAGLHRR